MSLFYHSFVKTNQINKKFHKYLHEAFDLRKDADYSIESSIDDKTATDLMKNADEFITEIKKLLEKL